MWDREVEEIRQQFLQDLRGCRSSKDLEEIKVRFVGKKSPLKALMDKLKDLSQEERPLAGKLINDVKVELLSHLDNALERFVQEEQEKSLSKETVDISLPGDRKMQGFLHPVSVQIEEMLGILRDMGFSIQYAPNVDTDYYNFGSLNFPPDHPARDMQDTFYLSTGDLLRTHTSNIQVRMMEKLKPPLRVASPGRCFRNETISSRSHVFFHQIDVFYIDKNVSFADLMYTITEFYRRVFGKHLDVRFRPSYFPFVEPGMELDMHCMICNGKGCKVCKHTGWLEITGAGMIHPEVLKAGGLDPELYSGYAWGGGIERVVMLLNGVQDLRLFWDNNSEFLQQFSM